MSRKEIEERLKTLIRPYVQNNEAYQNISSETDLLSDLQINSAHLVDIILDMEDEFDVEIGDDDAEKMLTVGEAIDITERLMSARG